MPHLVMNSTPVTMRAEMNTLYVPIRSRSMTTAKAKVKTGVQKKMAEAFPRGTSLTAMKMQRRRQPPRRPWKKIRTRFFGGPLSRRRQADRFRLGPYCQRPWSLLRNLFEDGMR